MKQSKGSAGDGNAFKLYNTNTWTSNDVYDDASGDGVIIPKPAPECVV